MFGQKEPDLDDMLNMKEVKFVSFIKLYYIKFSNDRNICIP